jgi:anaerobic magnesium-protoporphyrin IX monomethyl ester cyclase
MANRSVWRIALVQMSFPGISWSDLGLGTSYLKAYLDYYRPGVYSTEIHKSPEFKAEVIQRASEYDVIGISTVSHLYSYAKEIARAIKMVKNAPIVVVGGPHITCAPYTLSPHFDYGVVGEGEQTFLELLDSLRKGCADRDTLTVPGVIGRRNGQLICQAKRPLISNLDSLPFPDLQIFKQYRAVPSLLTTRGCPYDCKFCVSHMLWTRRVRRPSPGRLVEQLVQLLDVLEDLEVIVFKDDIAFISKSYLQAVLHHTHKTAPEILAIPKVAYVRADAFDEAFARLLKEFGFYKLVFGFESGSERVLRILKGDHSTVAQNQRAIDICYDLGFKVRGHFILGTPEEEVEDVIASFEFILKNSRTGRLGGPTTNILAPFPGSRYWPVFLESGQIQDLDHFQWDRLDERGFNSYYADHGGKVSVADWWRYREENRKVYLGGIPKECFVSLLEEYQYEVVETHAAFVAQDYKY